jgi:hypothetical protein
MPENEAPPVPALLPQQTVIESDGFDFQPAAPQSDPFGFPALNAAPAAPRDTAAFDTAAGSEHFDIPQTAPLSVSTAAGLTRTAPALVVEEPPSLPPPPPQVDDDPYDLHINRPVPVPQPPIATAAPQPRKSFTEDKKPQSKSASGDPFSELVAPLKPTPPPGVSNPFAKPANPLDSLPLNALLAVKQTSIVAAQVAPTSSAPVAVVGAPVAVTASAPVRVATADPFSAPAVPFAPPSVSAAPEDFDLFDQLTAPRAAAPVVPPAAPPVPVISPADFDIFAAKAKPAAVAAKTVAVTAPVDPFAAPIDPFASAQSGAPVVEDDTFDVFGLPKPALAQQKRPSHTLPVPPVPAKAAVTHKAAPAPKATVPPPLETSQPIVPHAKRQAPTAAPTAAPPEPDVIFSPADYRKTSSQSFDHVADDPFASSVVPAHANDLFDDPFATHADPRDKEEIDDPLARLRQTYGLSAQHSDDEDEHHHDPSDVLHDAFDDFDDFTFDQAHHGGRTAARPGGDLSRPTKQSASGRSAGSAATSKSAGSASSDVVNEDGVLAQGEILSRLSTKAMLTRDWHDTYYAIVKDQLYVFRHRADYFQYQAQAQNRRVQRGSTEDASPLYKKRIDLVYNLKLEPIKGKEYKTLGMVYNFSLELIEDYGPKDLGKFGSTDRETVQTLWNHIRDVVMAKRKEVRLRVTHRSVLSSDRCLVCSELLRVPRTANARIPQLLLSFKTAV